MKRIDLGKGYVIDIDSLNYTLKKNVEWRSKKVKEVSDDGSVLEKVVEYESSKTIGYYSKLENVLNAYYKEKVIDTLEDKQTLKMALNVLREVKDMVAKQFDGIEM